MTDPTSSHAKTGFPTVLIAEDETDLADLYAAWLEDSYTVKTAYQGDEALNKLDETIDVVLLDRRMPGLSGDEVLNYIRTEELDVRVAIVSAVTPDFDVLDMGFDDYLTKPVDADDLHDAVERMLRRAEYDETIREFYQLVSTRAALEAEKSYAELRTSDEYDALQERIADLQAETDALVSDFTSEDFEASVRDLESKHSDRFSADDKN